jgi:predicted dehydrogenase
VKKLRLGVIGAGSWAISSHLPNFGRHADKIEPFIVNRPEADLVERVRTRFGFAHATTDWHDVIEARPDVVLVASPPSLHHEHAKAALQAGAHVLCEKPFTLEPDDAWDLVRTVEQTGRHLAIAYGWNYRPMVQDAKRLLEEDGGIGEIEQMSLHMASVTRELLSDTGAYPDASPEAAPRSETWVNPSISGGGYGQAQLTHILGLALWLTGLRGSEVFAFMSSPVGAPVELHDAIALRFEGGAIGSIAGGSCHLGSGRNKHQVEVRAIGSRGQIHVDLERELVWRFRPEDGDVRSDLEPSAGLYDCIGPVDTIVDLALGRPADNRSPAELGARTVEILEAAYRSAASGGIAHVRLSR